MSLKIIQTGTIRKPGCGFLFAFHSNYGSIISKIKQDIGKNRDFFHTTPVTPPFNAPVTGSPSEYCNPVWYGKTRMVGLSDGEKTLRICVTIQTEYQHVTDGRRDILPRHSPRYAVRICVAR